MNTQEEIWEINQRSYFDRVTLNPITRSYTEELEFFSPLISSSFESLCDVGAGPLPIYRTEKVTATHTCVVDPLFDSFLQSGVYPQSSFDERYESIVDCKSQRYHIVTCFRTLNYGSDPDELLYNVHRIIKHGGYVFLSAKLKDPLALYKVNIRALAFMLASLFEPIGGGIHQGYVYYSGIKI